MSERTEQLLDEIVRLMVLSLRHSMANQTELILACLQVGLEPTRIADLLQTTPATVRAARQKAAKRAAGKPSSRSDRAD